jgi:hypothetical protein
MGAVCGLLVIVLKEETKEKKLNLGISLSLSLSLSLSYLMIGNEPKGGETKDRKKKIS